MQKQKLLKLAAGLRSLTRSQQRHFDMNHWVYIPSQWDENGDYKKTDEIELVTNCGMPTDTKKISCNTAACALGWAPTFFPRSKLKITFSKDDGLEIVYGKEFYGLNAASKMFDLTWDQSAYLFNPDYYNFMENITAKQVAKRIEKLVETNGKSCEKYIEETGQTTPTSIISC